MDNKKIGDFISNLRKGKNLTQKELAALLGVTDKAISKWERGAGYPDISLLKPLADILGTSTNELLEGETCQDHLPDKKNIHSALQYADKIIRRKEINKSRTIAAICAISLFIAILTCVIVNVAVNHRISWSYIVIGGCVLGGSLLIPPILYKVKGLFISLSLLTLFIIPFLAVIQAQDTSNAKWLWPLAFPVSVTWLIILWFLVLLCRIRKFNVWFLFCIIALTGIPGQLITNRIIDHYIKTVDAASRQISAISSVIAFVAVAGIFAVIGLSKRKPVNSDHKAA